MTDKNQIVRLDYYSWVKLIRTLASNVDLNVHFEDVPQPRTDGRIIYAPRPPPPSASEDEWWVYWHLLIHEMGHNRPEAKDCFEIPKKYCIDMKSITGIGLNILDDYRQERLQFGEYQGVDEILKRGTQLMGERVAQNLGKAPGDPMREIVETMIAWDYDCRSKWMRNLDTVVDESEKNLSAQSKEWLGKLRAGPYEQLLNEANTAEQELVVLNRIFKDVFDLDAQDEQNRDPQGRAKAMAGGKGKGDGKGEQEQSGGGKEDGEEESPRTEAAEVDYADLVRHIHDDKNSQYMDPNDEAPLKINYRNDEYYGPVTPREPKILDAYKSRGQESGNIYGRCTMPTNSSGMRLSKKLKRLLMIHSQAHYEFGKKAGRLHRKNVHRATLTKTGDFQQKIFKKKQESFVLDTAVLCLGDMSGSMCGSKYGHMAVGCSLVNDAISPLGVALKIVGFTEDHTGPIHVIFKDWDSRVPPQKMLDAFRRQAYRMSQNADGESIMWGYNQIITRPERRKIILVLSDGSPASCNPGDQYVFTKQIVSNIEKSSVEIYGIGICDRNVKNIYRDHVCIQSDSQLEPAMLEVLKRKMIP